MNLPPLPLLHNDDSFILRLEEPPLRLVSIERYSSNRNVEGEAVLFFQLDEESRRAVLQQIHRRYPGKVVKVQ